MYIASRKNYCFPDPTPHFAHNDSAAGDEVDDEEEGGDDDVGAGSVAGVA